MKPVIRLFAFSILLLFVVDLAVASAQWDKKEYTQWSEKDAQKVLDNSPWGQTQTVSDTSGTFSTGVGVDNPQDKHKPGQSIDDSAVHLNFRIRLLSSRPVRQAFSRLIELRQKENMNEQLARQLKALATQDMPDFIVVAVDLDSKEARDELSKARALLFNRITADLKNSTYIEAKGQKVFLQEYQPPKKDGFGARFVFPRLVDGKPFLATDASEIHFFSELSKTYVLNMRFKTKDLMFNGKLEY